MGEAKVDRVGLAHEAVDNLSAPSSTLNSRDTKKVGRPVAPRRRARELCRMASNKNQHFVPRCYLRPFTDQGKGKAINLFNLDRQQAIPRAPVKGQCSGDYFYGEDLELETLLQSFEGEYATRLLAILAPNYQLTAADEVFLRRFWRLQYLRTEAASLRAVQMLQQMGDDLGAAAAEFKTTVKEAVQAAMYTFFAAADVVSDLKVRLVRNHTDRDFITSDNPAVMSNRWHLTDPRVRGVAPGLQNAGVIGLLPLSPQVLCILYDGDLHTIPHQAGWIDATTVADVDAFNEHQVLNCEANLYFREWDGRDRVSEAAHATMARRPQARHQIVYMAFDRRDARGKIYVPVSAAEASKRQDVIVHSASVLAVPTRWPKQLGWRPGGVVYDSGNGSGFLRSARRDGGANYKKIRVRP